MRTSKDMGFNESLKLSTRFNILVILMILVTSIGTVLFVIIEENANNYEELLNRGKSLADVISKNSDYSIFTEDQKSLQQLADSTLTDSNVAYVAILNAEKRILVYKNRNVDMAIPPASRISSTGDKINAEMVIGKKDGKHYVDILAPVVSTSAGDLSAPGQDMNTGTKTIGYVQVGLSQDGLRKRIRNFLFSTLLFTSLFAAFGVAATLFITKRITLPIKKLVAVAQDISRGKLDHSIEKEGGIELSSLAAAIENMSANLKDMISKINHLASNVSLVTQTITESPASVLRVVDLQRISIEQAADSISEMDKSIAAVSLSSDSLYQSAEEASAAALEMKSSVSGVAENAAVFQSTAQAAASSVGQMISAIRDISGSLSILSSSSVETSSTLLEISSSIDMIRVHSEESVKLAELVSVASSERGISAIDTAVLGIEEARRKVGDLSAAIQRLGTNSAKIDAIVNVIDDVADQTSLLALNAAIISAQAGHNGKAFAVVAEEIRELAEKTSNSTKEIAALISSVQAETQMSIKMAQEGIKSVNDGVSLVQEVRGALYDILESSKTSTEKSRAINSATAKEANAIRSITESIKKQSEQVEFISNTTREQSEGSKRVIDAIEKVKALANHLMASTTEQLEFSRSIARVSDNVSGQAEQITGAIRDQKRQSGDMVAVTEGIRKTTSDLIASAGEMNRSIISLSKDAQDLLMELRKFKV